MRSFPFHSVALALFVATSSTALAQAPARTPATAKPAPAATPASTATPAATPAMPGSGAAPASTPTPGAPTTYTAPEVNDPMLVPVPPPAKVIGTWQEALNLVRSRSTDLRIAYDEVKRAEAQQRVALAGTLPILNVNGAVAKNLITKTTPASTIYTVTDGNGNQLGSSGFNPADLTNGSAKYGPVVIPGGASVPSSDPYATASITAVQPLLALRVWHNMGTTKVSTEASKLSMEDVKRSLALGVANALVGVVTAERVAELNRIGLAQSLQRLDLTERKMKLGAANGLDVVRAQQDVESARTTLVTGDESLRRSREALGIAVGIPAEIGVARDLRIDGLERDAVSACRPASSVEDRADILAAKKRLAVAMRNIDDVWLQFAPTVNAQSTLATTTIDTGFAPATTWNIQGVLSFPLWDGGARYGFLHDTRAQADEAQTNLEALRRNAIIQVEQAQRAVTVANDQLAVEARARDLAVKNDELTQSAYREGQGTSLDLVVTAAGRRQAEIQYALDEFNLVEARVAAILALANCDW